MTSHATMIEKAYNAANTALGIEPNYPKPISDAFKRRDAAVDLLDLKPLNPAHELQASPNVRQWPSVLDRCAAHNARAQAAQDAIKGGILTSATAQLDHALKAYVPEHSSAVYKAVEAHVNGLTEAAQHCPTLNADSAVKGGYGDAMTRFYQHAQVIVTYADIGSVTAPADRAAQAARALALVTDPGRIDPIKRTPASRWNEGGELRSPESDVRRRDIARGLLTDWIGNPVETLRKLGRDEYDGFSLSPATADTYTDRVEQFANADRIIRVDD